MRHLERLGQKIAKIEDRFANLRLTFFALAAAAGLAGVIRNDWRPVAYSVAFVFFAGFITMVWKHQFVQPEPIRSDKESNHRRSAFREGCLYSFGQWFE